MHLFSHPFFSFSLFTALTAGAVVHRHKSAEGMEGGCFHFDREISAVM